MRFSKDDILSALGIEERGFSSWYAPALIGFGVGALAGTIVALLVAPRAGSELRDDLLARGRRIVQRGREAVQETTGNGGREPQPNF
jgi:hypothetical protein